MPQDEPYHISVISKEDTDAVMKFLRRTFFIDEPLNQAVGLYTSESDTCQELEEYCINALAEAISFKATDNEGNLVSVMISGRCEISENDGPKYIKMAEMCENPKFKKILYILAKREEGARLWEKFPSGMLCVDVKIVSTDPAWRRRGIMNKLLLETEKESRKLGIKLMRLDTSSAYSAMSGKKLGFTTVYSAAYKDILMDGQPLIVPAPPHDEDKVNIKTLD